MRFGRGRSRRSPSIPPHASDSERPREVLHLVSPFALFQTAPVPGNAALLAPIVCLGLAQAHRQDNV